jgi:hypothetical protein
VHALNSWSIPSAGRERQMASSKGPGYIEECRKFYKLKEVFRAAGVDVELFEMDTDVEPYFLDNFDNFS